MANVSPELLWGAVRDTSCYLLRRKQSGRSGMGKRGAEFTTEPNNLTSRNAWKYSGIANAKTIGLDATEGGVVLTTKSRKSSNVGKVRPPLEARQSPRESAPAAMLPSQIGACRSERCCQPPSMPGCPGLSLTAPLLLCVAAFEDLQQGHHDEGLPPRRQGDHQGDCGQLLQAGSEKGCVHDPLPTQKRA
jgi:hypothetical protein